MEFDPSDLARAVMVGCVVGDAAPVVLPVTPRHIVAPRRAGMAAYNPSIVRYGSGYLVSYRIDWQSGCAPERNGLAKSFSARRGDRHTAVVRTDAALRPIGPARVLDACGRNISTDSTDNHDAGTQIVDVRLARVPGLVRQASGEMRKAMRVWITYMPMNVGREGRGLDWCRSCCRRCDKSTHLAELRIHDSERGARGDWTVQLVKQTPLCEAAVKGRNHVLIPTADGKLRVLAWLRPLVIADVLEPRARTTSSPTEDGPTIAQARQVSSALAFRATRNATDDSACSAARMKLTLSGTSPLVRVRARGRRLLLGIGHVHHTLPRRQSRSSQIRAYFGSEYMHFWFALDRSPPHALLAHSAEWCLPSRDPQHANRTGEGGGGGAPVRLRCDVVQFVTGLELAQRGDSLILAWGVNDCEARFATYALQDALDSLEWPPLAQNVSR
jgi:hypothetical protein